MKLIPHIFSAYELTAEEELQGQVLTVTQSAVLQNQLAAVSKNKLELTFDTANPNAFIQQEAYLRGQYDLLSHLLNLDQLAKETLSSNTNQQ